MEPIPIFLAVAIVIIAAAVLLSWGFRETIRRDRQMDDPNGNRRDGDASATWIGVDEGDNS